MAFKSPIIDGARQEIGGLKSPVIDGVRQAIACLKKCVDGAWKEVWGNVKLLYKVKAPTNGSVTSPTEWGDYTEIYTFDTDWYSDQVVIYVTDGEFTNPTISLTVYGENTYSNQKDGSVVGAIVAYGEDANGQITLSGVDPANASGNIDWNVRHNQTNKIEYTLTGNFVKVGFKFVGFYYDSDEYNICRISEILIDGQKYITDSSYDYDNTSN